MDLVKLKADYNFDSGPQPILNTIATMQRICRIQNRLRRTTAAVIVAGGTISDFQIQQSAYPDDPNPLIVADGTGFNSPALANQSYIIPALAFPFGPGVFQVHLQGDAAELIFLAQGASTANVTVQVKGSCSHDLD